MKKELIMDAIGDISNEHIMEFADAECDKIYHRKKMGRMIAAVACFCIIVSGAIVIALYHNNSLIPPNGGVLAGDFTDTDKNDNGSEDKQNGLQIEDENIIGDSFGVGIEDETHSAKENGTVKVTPFLYQAIIKSDDPNEVFKVNVIEKNASTRQEIYDAFASKTDAGKDFLKSGFLYATKAQIEELVCPENMAIVLYHEEEEDSYIYINKKTIDVFDEETLTVEVRLHDDQAVNAALKEYSDQGIELSGKDRNDVIAKAVDSVLEPFFNDYNLSEEDLVYRYGLFAKFQAELSKGTIKELLADKRVAQIIMYKEIEGSDFSNDSGNF